MADSLIPRIIGEIKTKMNEHAHNAMLMYDQAKSGEVAGEYRGMQTALDIIDNVLRAGEEEDNKL